MFLEPPVIACFIAGFFVISAEDPQVAVGAYSSMQVQISILMHMMVVTNRLRLPCSVPALKRMLAPCEIPKCV